MTVDRELTLFSGGLTEVLSDVNHECLGAKDTKLLCLILPFTGSDIHTYILTSGHCAIHSGHFYSASSSPILLGSAPDTARILCRSFMPKCHRQLRMKDLPKVLC